ncbi:Lactonase, 7-bladed beta-propeller-domain-containing protein [Astrocystis sublimbata]|nr:Lactonase, 7-bladed beta-propeller-domain-containing protein [Astrocystis sublimbata]
MRTGSIFPAAAGLLAGSTSATRFFVTSYAGTITTLDLVEGKLETVTSTTACGAKPSWLDLDYSNSLIYCLDEAWDEPTGAITSFSIDKNGSLTDLESASLVGGPVSIAEFGADNKGLAIASYAGSGVNVVSRTLEGGVELVQNETYTLEQPGPIPDRQDVPHPHEAILDPTAKFILVPDLGADLVRVFQADAETLELTPIAPLEVPPASGPRHGAFKAVGNKTYFWVVTELSNVVLGYEVSYKADNTLGFTELFSISTHGDDSTLPETAAGGEIALSPDGKFLLVSSRLEDSLTIPNFDPSNSTEIVSDPMITFSIDDATGSLKKVQEFPAGGRVPRHFSISADGTQVAVGLQADGRVVIIGRDVQTGKLTDFIASADVPGEVNAVIFYEDNHAKRGKKCTRKY